MGLLLLVVEERWGRLLLAASLRTAVKHLLRREAKLIVKLLLILGARHGLASQ